MARLEPGRAAGRLRIAERRQRASARRRTRTPRGGSSSPSTSPNRVSVSICPPPAIRRRWRTGTTRAGGTRCSTPPDGSARRVSARRRCRRPGPACRRARRTTGTASSSSIAWILLQYPFRRGMRAIDLLPPAANASMSGDRPAAPDHDAAGADRDTLRRHAGSAAAARAAVPGRRPHRPPRPAPDRREIAAGERYWTTSARGTDADQAWAQLLKDAGATRAIWVREALTPTNADRRAELPDAGDRRQAMPASRRPRARCRPASLCGCAAPAASRSCRDARSRPACRSAFRSGRPRRTPPPPPRRRPETTRRSCSTRACAGWSISTPRVAVGMAVAVDLPPNTELVQDVVAVGLPVGERRWRRAAHGARSTRTASATAPRSSRRARRPTTSPIPRAATRSRRGAGAAARRRAGGRLRRRRARCRLGHRPAGARAARRRRRSRARRGAADGPRAVRGDLGRLPAPAGPAGLRPEPAAARVRARDRRSCAAAAHCRFFAWAASPTRSRR